MVKHYYFHKLKSTSHYKPKTEHTRTPKGVKVDLSRGQKAPHDIYECLR